MKKIKIVIFSLLTLALTNCAENYSNGDRVGMLTKFNKEGVMFKTWEGELNITQTGMNSAGEPFNFSIDKKKQSRRRYRVNNPYPRKRPHHRG